MDSIPVLAQVKWIAQGLKGDVDGMERAMHNFSGRCVGVSQVRSIVDLCKGDPEAALKTQKEFLEEVSSLANSAPVVGHVKGVIHYVCGDKQGGAAAIKASSRATGSMAGGVARFVIGGPAGAFAGGIWGGTAVDTVISGISVATDDNAELHGTLGLICDICEKDDKAGSVVDLAGTVVFDGLSGTSAGKSYERTTRTTN